MLFSRSTTIRLLANIGNSSSVAAGWRLAASQRQARSRARSRPACQRRSVATNLAATGANCELRPDAGRPFVRGRGFVLFCQNGPAAPALIYGRPLEPTRSGCRLPAAALAGPGGAFAGPAGCPRRPVMHHVQAKCDATPPSRPRAGSFGASDRVALQPHPPLWTQIRTRTRIWTDKQAARWPKLAPQLQLEPQPQLQPQLGLQPAPARPRESG